jgi:hypothetical protein
MRPKQLSDEPVIVKDALELELRQLPGVLFVSFSEQEDLTLIEIVVSAGTDHVRAREEAARCAISHLEEPAEIRVLGPPQEQPVPVRRERVRLVLVLPSDGGAAIEVQLSRGFQRYSTKAVAGDTAAVGRAVLEALRGLGAHAPFDVVGFHALPSDWGAGLLAVLRDTTTGDLRRGVATGRAPADAAARAVLAALNRSL